MCLCVFYNKYTALSYDLYHEDEKNNGDNSELIQSKHLLRIVSCEAIVYKHKCLRAVISNCQTSSATHVFKHEETFVFSTIVLLSSSG